MKNKYLCIIQARMGSTRLPGKVLKKAGGTTLLEYEIKRVRLAKKIDKIVVATTVKSEDQRIVKLCEKLGIASFRGSESDVLDRYYKCSKQHPGYDIIVRITGDCPLIDPRIVDEVIEFFLKGKFDYANNVSLDNPGEETFPDGMDTEVFTKNVLYLAAREAKLWSQREHVTWYMRKNRKLKRGLYTAPHDFSHFRLTVDNPEDFEVVKFVIEHSKPTDDYLSYISLLTKYPGVMLKNSHIARDEGLKKSLKEDFVITR